MRYNHLFEGKRGYSGYAVSDTSRARLLSKLPPLFPDVYAHHVTYKFGVGEDEVPSHPTESEIVGYASDDSLEAYVVSIDGNIYRPDGKIYHVTWSLDKSAGRKPVQSNELIESGWKKIQPIPIDLIPKFFSF